MDDARAGDYTWAMTLWQLKTLLAVIETGSFSAAALELDSAQSAVSYAVAELERDLGVRLLERGRFGARPTAVGVRVAAHARAMLGLSEAVRQEAALERGSVQGRVRVATFRSMASQVLPKVMARLRRSYPELEVGLLEADGDVPELERLLLEGYAEVAFSQAPFPQEALSWSLLQDPYVALLPQGHPLANVPVERSDLLTLPLILYDDNHRCGLNVQRYLQEAGRPLRATMHNIREDSTIFSLVAQGLGVSVVPELAFRDLPDTVARVPLAEPLVRTIGVAISPQSLKIPAVRVFLDALKAQFPESGVPAFRTGSAATVS